VFGLDQAAGHGKTHLAEANESDVHDDFNLCPIRLIFRLGAV
jgi:hypothetical protein